jgi:hypothetical protein
MNNESTHTAMPKNVRDYLNIYYKSDVRPPLTPELRLEMEKYIKDNEVYFQELEKTLFKRKR